MTTERHVAHLNWGILRADWDDPLVAPFADAVERVNARASAAPGFVWRHGDDAPEDFGALSQDPRLAATLSVWESATHLRAFVMRSVHGAFLRRRAEWFVPQPGPTYVIWPIAAGHRPAVAEAAERLDRLARRGPGSDAHDFAWLDESGRAAFPHGAGAGRARDRDVADA